MHISIYWPTAHFAKEFGTQRPLLNKKKVWPLLHLSRPADVKHCLFFAKSNHIIHACHRLLNTSLICPLLRMVIHIIFTSVLTSPPYFTNYDSKYFLQHFAVKMHEYHSGSELKLAIWGQMRTHAKKYFEMKNTFGWSKAGQLQMDQSPAVYCLKFGFCLQCTSDMFTSATFTTFNSLGNFCSFSGLVWRVQPI